jgi:hypothetical protein
MKRTSFLSTTLLLAASMWGGNALAINISLDPADVGPITSGQTVTVDIVASDLGTEVITAFDMAVAYDDALLTLDSTTYSTALGDPACELLDFSGPCADPEALFDGSNIEGPGFADPNLFSLLDIASLAAIQGGGGDIILATLSFTANADAQMTSFALDWGGINDVKCNNAERPSDLDYVCYPQDMPMPEPGTMLLLSLGILGLGASRRRLRDRS